jgi:uroporphyrinogen III methyltransferase / synthase
MNILLKDRPLTNRTILIAPSATTELATELVRLGARVLTWPGFAPGPPDNYQLLDEAIENLFGYDWVVFQNINAAEFFLRRFHELGHETHELDGFRVCGVGEETVHELQASHVHVDAIANTLSSAASFSAITDYVGGREGLRGLNFLIPAAGMSQACLKEMLDDAGARADSIAAYRSCSPNDSSLTCTIALLAGGGIDCSVFTTSLEVEEFAAVFDTNELGRFLTGTNAICLCETTAFTAASFGLKPDVTVDESSPTATGLAQAIALHFLR